jgi:hypothetical protein
MAVVSSEAVTMGSDETVVSSEAIAMGSDETIVSSEAITVGSPAPARPPMEPTPPPKPYTPSVDLRLAEERTLAYHPIEADRTAPDPAAQEHAT